MNDSDTNHLTEIDAEIAAAVEKLRDAAVTPHGRAAALWGRFTRDVDPTRIDDALTIIREPLDKIAALITNGRPDDAVREIDRVADSLRYGAGLSLSLPRPVPSQREIHDVTLRRFGYLTEERDGLFAQLGAGEEITGITWWTVTTSTRRIERDELRRSIVPRLVEDPARWLAALPKVPTRAEIEKQAETDPAIAAVVRRLS